MKISNWYEVRSKEYREGTASPLEAVQLWRNISSAELWVTLWNEDEGEDEAVLLGSPINITHLALHLVENEREREQGRVR